MNGYLECQNLNNFSVILKSIDELTPKEVLSVVNTTAD